MLASGWLFSLDLTSLSTVALGLLAFLSTCPIPCAVWRLSGWHCFLLLFLPCSLLLFFSLYTFLPLILPQSRFFFLLFFFSLPTSRTYPSSLLSYWPFNFLSEQSGALDRQHETIATHLYTIKHMYLHC